MVLMVSSPDSAEALCPEGVLHMLQLALAGSQVLQPVRGVVLEGGGPGGLAVDLQGNGQGRRSHTGRSKSQSSQDQGGPFAGGSCKYTAGVSDSLKDVKQALVACRKSQWRLMTFSCQCRIQIKEAAFHKFREGNKFRALIPADCTICFDLCCTIHM